MKKIALCLFVAVSLLSCSNAGLSTYEKESKAVYKVIVDRAEQYDQERVSVYYQSALVAIDQNNWPMIRHGLKTYNSEIQKAVDDFNKPETGDFLRALGGLRIARQGDIAYQLSKVGFDDAFEYAVAFEKDLLKPEISHSSFLFLQKHDGHWAIESEIMEQ